MRTPGLPGTCYPPTLWIWEGRALYVGPSLRLDPHAGSVSCLAVALDGTFRVHRGELPGPDVRSALIPPRWRHRIVATADRMAFCYVDPGSPRHRACQDAMTVQDAEISYGHRHEDALARTAAHLADADLAEGWLEFATGPRSSAGPRLAPGPPARGGVGARDRPDPRIEAATAVLRELDPGEKASAAHLAALVGLSASRFLHLFRDHTGTSFRRYRLWLRMLRVAERVQHGSDLTTAAADAGFASPSHFSDSFHAMFGLRPSRLLGIRIRVA